MNMIAKPESLPLRPVLAVIDKAGKPSQTDDVGR